jgi:FtsP/CotA-like multicopper oxidase with cupredoxin domain
MNLGLRHIAPLLLAGGAAVAVFAFSVNPVHPADRTPVENAFNPQRGLSFEQPVVLRSAAGRLRATFTVQQGPVSVAGVQVRATSYAGDFIGPTLRVHPGDTIEIRLVNRLSEPTNLHEHGFHVSPIGISDNVLRTMPAGSDSAVRVAIPRSLSPGTYWYHAHMHGRVEEQIASGLSGVILVDGLTQRLPRALRHVPDRVVALKDLQVRNGAIVTEHIDSNAPTTRTVNGLIDPVLRVRTNQTQLLRLANIGADIFYRLRLDGTRFTVIAEDGNPVGTVWGANELILPPGKRYDVLVRWPRPGTYDLRTLAGCRRAGAAVAWPAAAASTRPYQAGPPPDVR